jgi:AbrB family looped-hinge helix DNA binding protein
MFGNLEFFGSTTVGERGQVVLPIELRKKMQLQAGDKVIALGAMGDNIAFLLKADFLTQILGKMEEGQNELRQFLKDFTDSEIIEGTKVDIE